MATVAEIKAAKREELDKLAVEAGHDPKAFPKVEDLRKELLAGAEDAEPAEPAEPNGDDEGDADGGDAGDSKDTKPAENQADQAADKAETPTKEVTTEAPSGHAVKFDKFGQPIFGGAKGR